jgi:peptide/nickel transport system substrate-binding protein
MGSTMVTFGDGVGTWNVGSYSNPEVDRLVAAAESEMDRGKRREMMTKALSIHRDDVGTIPLYQPVLTYAARSNVTIVPRLDDAIQLRWVKFK